MDKAAPPVEEELGAVHHGNLHAETSLLVQAGILILLSVAEDVHVVEQEGFQLFEVLGHILDPTNDGNGILLVASIHKVLTGVFGGIIRQETAGNHGVCGLLTADLNDARTFLVLADHDLQLVVAISHQEGSLARLWVHVALLVIPELAVIDGAVLKEGNLPVALVVAPIGWEQLFPALFHRFDALDLESALSVALDEVERFGSLRQWWEVENHIALAVLVSLKVLVEFNTVGRNDGVALLTHFQIGIARKLEPIVGIVRALQYGDIHHGLVGFQFHLRQVEGEMEESVAIAGSILDGGLLPHHIFRLARHCDKGQHHG